MEIPNDGADGVLLAHGNRNGGYTLFLKDNHLHHVHNYCGKEMFRVTSPAAVPSGRVKLRYEFEPTGEADLAKGLGTPGNSQLYVDDELVAATELPYTVPNMFSIIGLTCGYDGIDAVSPADYKSPNSFAGVIHEANNT